MHYFCSQPGLLLRDSKEIAPETHMIFWLPWAKLP